MSDTTFVLISEEGIDCHTTYVITLDSTSLREMFSGIDSSGLGRGLSSRGIIPSAAMEKVIRAVTLLNAW